MQQFLRTFWGILTLLSILWMCYGFSVSSAAFSSVVSTPAPVSGNLDQETADAARTAGAGIGASLGIGLFLCTGLPVFLLSAILYWRNGVAITRQKQHKEMLAAIAAGQQPPATGKVK